MTISEFINNYTEPYHDYIVRLAYRYKFENFFHVSNEVLFTNEDNAHIWLNDWNEGYTNDGEVIVIDFIDIDEVFLRSRGNVEND